MTAKTRKHLKMMTTENMERKAKQTKPRYSKDMNMRVNIYLKLTVSHYLRKTHGR